MPNLIEYEVVRVGPELEAIKEALNSLGRHGYQVLNTHSDDSGVYTFVLSKDTGRPAEVPSETAGEWIDDGFVNEETSWT